MAEYSTLLSTKEQTVCKKLSSQKTLDGKRAKALLELNDGDTQTIAAKKSGLSYGQVKYLLTIFRKKRLSVFSDLPDKLDKPVANAKTKKSKDVKKMKKKDKKEKKKKLKSKIKKQKDKKSKKKKSKKSKKK